MKLTGIKLIKWKDATNDSKPVFLLYFYEIVMDFEVTWTFWRYEKH